MRLPRNLVTNSAAHSKTILVHTSNNINSPYWWYDHIFVFRGDRCIRIVYDWMWLALSSTRVSRTCLLAHISPLRRFSCGVCCNAWYRILVLACIVYSGCSVFNFSICYKNDRVTVWRWKWNHVVWMPTHTPFCQVFSHALNITAKDSMMLTPSFAIVLASLTSSSVSYYAFYLYLG